MNNSSEFYDQFIAYQVQSGINDRILGLYKRLKKYGLSSSSSILEIGCGIGSLTYLLSRKVKKGTVEATDISPKSITFAKQHLTSSQVQLTAGNILQYKPTNQSFEFILLFDVLEHIPITDHEQLFANIFCWMLDDSLLLINIPNPEYLVYTEKHHPEDLQEVDQPITMEHLTTVLAKNSLTIEYMETYGVWVKNEYQFLVVRKKTDFKEERLENSRIFLEKTIVWFERKCRSLSYRYP